MPKYGANPNNFVAGEVFCYEPTNDNFAGIVKCPYSKEFENSEYLSSILSDMGSINNTQTANTTSKPQMNSKSSQISSSNNKNANTQDNQISNTQTNATNINNLEYADYKADFKQELNFSAYKYLYDTLPISKRITCKNINAYDKLVAKIENLRAQTDYLDKNKKFVKVLVVYGKSECCVVVVSIHNN